MFYSHTKLGDRWSKMRKVNEIELNNRFIQFSRWHVQKGSLRSAKYREQQSSSWLDESFLLAAIQIFQPLEPDAGPYAMVERTTIDVGFSVQQMKWGLFRHSIGSKLFTFPFRVQSMQVKHIFFNKKIFSAKFEAFPPHGHQFITF